MGGLSIWHILIVALIAMLLFGGRGKIADLMGDCGKGINSFRKGLHDGDDGQPAEIAEASYDGSSHFAARAMTGRR
jgi:sec-independent protein translocase protein TatA